MGGRIRRNESIMYSVASVKRFGFSQSGPLFTRTLSLSLSLSHSHSLALLFHPSKRPRETLANAELLQGKERRGRRRWAILQCGYRYRVRAVVCVYYVASSETYTKMLTYATSAWWSSVAPLAPGIIRREFFLFYTIRGRTKDHALEAPGPPEYLQ